MKNRGYSGVNFKFAPVNVGLSVVIFFLMVFCSLSACIGRPYFRAVVGAAGADLHGTPSPDSKRVAFISDRGGTMDLYVASMDGSGTPLRLTDDAALENNPCFSPDGRFIAYSSNPAGTTTWSIHIIASNGTGRARRLTGDDANQGNPAYFPDGRRIAYSTDINGNRDIFFINADGSGAIEEFITDASIDDDPAISPDGNWLAFHSDRSGDGNTDIYLKSLRGDNGIMRVTTDAAQDRSPWFSPDGSRLVFVSERPGASNDNIWMKELFNSDPPIRLTEFSLSEAYPKWTSDGQGFLFTRLDDTDPSDVNYNIWFFQTSVAVTDGGGRGNDLEPEVSPDGAAMVFASDRTGIMEIWLQELDGDGDAIGAPRQLTNGSQWARHPSWNGTSTQIAFSRAVNEEVNIWIIDRDGSNMRPVTANMKGASEPRWNHTSGEILYRSFWNGYENLFLVRPSDNTLRQLTHNVSLDRRLFSNPTWNQANSDMLAFERHSSGNTDIYLMNRTTQAMTRLSTSRAVDWGPFFSWDGARVYFNSNRRSLDDIYSMAVDSPGDEKGILYEGGLLRAANDSFDEGICLGPGSRQIYFSRWAGQRNIIYRSQTLSYLRERSSLVSRGLLKVPKTGNQGGLWRLHMEELRRYREFDDLRVED
ncbi:MAG: hypothetical protein CVV64_05535 [Candidatus Wallbacteria bacterium HGW-Wallbacteria-1]|jgi:TolB protein|uniref:DUF5050 domain-containing protein n=1 Tax=Candidatus Wallbacteria bacterium HGW-Wallbacteria-1 TaxID=2013854 RepID=A0A2N1PSI2_9BACT|nr:MAG: hypothetical protein CVV64_05535 [Candidatus Wallbacteria bacterium HGW-Wallbacteria-1]